MNDNMNQQDHEAEIVDLTENQTESGEDEMETQVGAPPVQVDLMNKLVRLQADFDNYRKRTASNRAETRDETRREVFLDLLPVRDNFQRALNHALEQEDFSSLRSGLEGILQQLDEVFRRNDVTPIPSEPGTAFDPNRHDALGTMPGNADTHDTIAQEILPGYEHKGHVIRAAQVLVYSHAE